MRNHYRHLVRQMMMFHFHRPLMRRHHHQMSNTMRGCIVRTLTRLHFLAPLHQNPPNRRLVTHHHQIHQQRLQHLTRRRHHPVT